MANDSQSALPRRGLLRHVALTGAAGGLAALFGFGRRADAAECAARTPAQTEGPFYPVRSQPDTDWDLTAGGRAEVLGEKIFIQGKVTDAACNPVAGALVEIWQACASGRYSHPGDSSGLPLDPNFQYWGRVLTDVNGEYLFKTVIPGDYPASQNWQRPPHVHYKVQKRGFHGVTTQMYFAGNRYNAGDGILQALPASEQAKVVCALRDADPAAGMPLRSVRFDIGLVRP